MPRATIHQMPVARAPRPVPESPPASANHPIAQRMIDDLERRLRDDTPVHLQIDTPTWREELADDWRSLVAEVRRSPVSHGLVALAGFLTPLVLLVVPFVIGGAL